MLKHNLLGISSSYPSHGSSYFTTDDSESDQCSGTSRSSMKSTNVFGETKTLRYNQPPRDKKILDKRDKIATRCSSRIQQLLQEKKKLDEVRIYLFTYIHNKYTQ